MAKTLSERKLNRLLELNRKLAVENDFSKKIALISNSVKDIIKAERCSIFIHDNATHSLWSIYIDSISYLEVPDDLGIVSQVYNTKKTVIENDVQNSEIFNKDIDEGTGFTTKSMLCVPIVGYGGIALGAMQLVNKMTDSQAFSEEDEEVVNYVMAHVSASLEIMLPR